MSLYERVADLSLRVETVEFDLRERTTSSGFDRATTTVALEGPNETGKGEDVTYDADDQRALARNSDSFDLAGEYTLDGFSTRLDSADLFPERGPSREDFRHYRRWAFESAALDLALRQADTHLAAALGRSYDPVRFVTSTNLGEPPTAERVNRWLEIDPALEFKLDATSEWTRGLVDELADTGSVRIVDLKGQYEDGDVAQSPDPELYRLILDGFPDALVEDPKLTDRTSTVFEGETERITWDVPIVDVDSIRTLPFEPGSLNVKPSRFGSVERLLDSVEHCQDRGIEMYGGGQFELGVGRGQIQLLASVFYPESPNDVAPTAYNDPNPSEGLPASPLSPPANPTGFRWE